MMSAIATDERKSSFAGRLLVNDLQLVNNPRVNDLMIHEFDQWTDPASAFVVTCGSTWQAAA
jgi:hypothetical protein